MNDFEAGTFEQEYRSPDGQTLWSVLNRADVVARMETASDLGRPALAAVEEILLAELGAVILGHRFKQMAGRMTRKVLEERGFEHEASGIRLNSVPFYKASRYRRRNRPGLYLFRSSSGFRDIWPDRYTRRRQAASPRGRAMDIHQHHRLPPQGVGRVRFRHWRSDLDSQDTRVFCPYGPTHNPGWLKGSCRRHAGRDALRPVAGFMVGATVPQSACQGNGGAAHL